MKTPYAPPHRMNLKWLSACLLTITLLSACNKAAFKVGSELEAEVVPDGYEVPAKIDILVAEDDSGSMYEGYEAISTQMPLLLERLEKEGWDWHLATTPLTRPRSIQQVSASRYDLNWGSEWKPSHPGAANDPAQLSQVPAHFFRFPHEYSDFVHLSSVNNDLNQVEPGFDTIKTVLEDRASKQSGFLRPDASLMIVTLSTGDDTSGMSFCQRPDGWVGPCSGSSDSSFSNARAGLQGLRTKGLTRDVRFYALVSTQPQANCLGSRAFAGLRYMRMAQELKGQSLDLCTQPIPDVLNALGDSIERTRVEFRVANLVLEREPDPATIRVTKFPGGDRSKGVSIAEDAVNGWTYAGYKTTYRIDYPVSQNQVTGFIVELHGSARLIGKDTASVEYRGLNGQESVED